MSDSFVKVIDRLNDGDEDAAAEVFNRFASRLIGLARTRMNSQVKRHVDPEDVVQSAFRSFFVRQREGRFELAEWDNLWGLLIRLTLRKCGRRVANLQAACRDVRRDVAPPSPTDSMHAAWEAATREPTPVEAALLSETVEQLMQGLEERERSIVTLRLQGYEFNEISEQVGRSERTVYRVMGQVRERLERLRDIEEN
ncbi:MAG: sigma-70 family RNA polymerase sigma factor [Planctomycetota bacterium]|nr:sigma-70 family RNA polymerase sigma factor [Planctomycetota bacterium]